MPKWRKWILILLAVVVVGGGLFWGALWIMTHRTPMWYLPDTSTPQERAAAAKSAENKLVGFYDWMADSHAAEVRSASGLESTTQTVGPAATQPAPVRAITFTDEELNSFFQKWAGADDRKSLYDGYVKDPRVVLKADRLIFAGKIKEIGLVVSMVFQPRIGQHGNLHMNLIHVMGGMLPLPDATWSTERKKVETMLKSKLVPLQNKATISPDGIANGAAASVAMNKLLWAMLHDQPASPVLFLPFDDTHMGRFIPVRVIAIEVKEGNITLTARQMPPAARAALLPQLKAAYAKPTKSSKAS